MQDAGIEVAEVIRDEGQGLMGPQAAIHQLLQLDQAEDEIDGDQREAEHAQKGQSEVAIEATDESAWGAAERHEAHRGLLCICSFGRRRFTRHG